MFNLIEEGKKLLSINSISQYGNEDVALYLEGLMKQMGLKTIMQEVAHAQEGVSKRQYNVIGILGDPLVDITTKKGLLLVSHTDTVSHGLKTNWSECDGNPFLPKVNDNKIYGLGSADAKLDLLCKLKACEKFIGRYLKMPVYVVGTAAEEIGMLGAKFLVKSKGLNPKYVLVGEPTELSVVHTHKAQYTVQISLHFNQLKRDAKGFNTRLEMKCIGRSAHSCHPDGGESAITTMFRALKKIKDSNFQTRYSKLMGGDFVTKVPDAAAIEFYIQSSSFDDFKKFYREKFRSEPYANMIQVEFGGLGDSGVVFLPDAIVDAIVAVKTEMESICRQRLFETDESFSPPGASMNFGKISHGQSSVDLQFDFRLLPDTQVEKLEVAIKNAMEVLGSKFQELILRVSRIRQTPPFSIKVGNELVISAESAQAEAGIHSGLSKKSMSTEAAIFQAAGYDTVVFGPGISVPNIHSPNEFNFIDQLERAVLFYEKMIEKTCL